MNMSKVAIVTGGTRGIGASISIALATAGYNVAAIYAANEKAALSFHSDTKISIYKWDVGNFEECMRGVKQVQSDLGQIQVLVNNAGITRDSMFHKMSIDQWQAVVNTNLNSLFNMCRPVIESMREAGFGRIINIASINAQKGQMGQANYSAAKAGHIGFTKALALENASKGITVNAICPGYIATDMVKAMPQEVVDKKILPQIPVGRLGTPQEVARCVLFLAADESSFITGATLTANGGQYMA
jgi:acetoacetyl-CoA reductase